MRRAAFAAGLISAVCQAAPTLQWDYPPDVGQNGFRVYCGATPISGTPAPVEVTETQWDAASLTRGTEHECWVTAFRDDEESPHSNHVQFTPMDVQIITLPSAPSGIRIQW